MRVRVAWELRCTRICGLFLPVRGHRDAAIYRRTCSLMSPYQRASDNASEPDAWITIKEIKEQLEPGTLPSPAAGRDLSTKHPISRIQSGSAWRFEREDPEGEGTEQSQMQMVVRREGWGDNDGARAHTPTLPGLL